MSYDVVFHIGYPKTATTWFQIEVFPKLHNVHYFGRYYTGNPYAYNYTPREINIFQKLGIQKIDPVPKNHDFIHRLSLLPDRMFDIKKTRKTLLKKLRSDSVNLYSSELILRPYSIQRTAARLASVTEGMQVRIIVTLRNQYDIILSRYCHDRTQIKMPSAYKLKDALNFDCKNTCKYPACYFGVYPCGCRKNGLKKIDMNFYNYFALAAMYSQYFGREKIHFMLFENIREDKMNEFDRLLKFIGVTEDKNLIDNILNKPPSGKRSDEIKEELLQQNAEDIEDIKARIFAYYQHPNRQLDEEYKLGIKKLAYY